LHDFNDVDVVIQYETKILKVEKIDMDRVAGIVFTSPSTVDAFIENYSLIPNVDIFCFGKFTKKRILEYREDLYVQTIQI
jgi:uroporphyrinogen-III synthase